MGRQSRQRPISCHLCRVRKLRCSRQFPCSNCTSRGLVCQHEGVGAAPVSDVASSQLSTTTSTTTKVSLPKDVSVHDILSRLEKLERVVASQSQEQNADRKYVPESSEAVPASKPVPPRLQRLMADALRLERSCSDPKLTGSILADPIVFRTCSTRLIANQPSFIFQDRGAFPSQQIDAIKCIWLPLRHEMRILVQKYISDISYFFHVVHVPTVQSLVEDIYNNLESNAPVDVGGILLLLSICASATYAWTSRDDAGYLFTSVAEANSQSTFWMKQALNVSDYAQRTAHASMEAVQGLVILFLVFCSQESISQRARNIIMSAIATATELSLHRIDGPLNEATSPIAKMSEAKKEIGRRVWWYLVTLDWLLAQFNNIQEGFCLLHPAQMMVNKPKNLRDEDLVEGREIVERPMSEPTCLSYLIQRIRLAELFQSIPERNTSTAQAAEAVSYNKVLETDKRLKEFIRELPEFLSLDSSSLSHLPPTDPRRSPLIAAQRYALNLILYRQLCKMHLPYLAQGIVDPAYAYSRDVCLRSARVVIELDHEFLEDHLQFCISKLRLAMVFRSIFLASIALALHAASQGDPIDGTEGNEETADAWQMLQEAHGQSPSGTRLLELSIQLLRKYKIKHNALELLQQQMSEATASTSGSQPITPKSTHPDQSLAPMSHAMGCACVPETSLLDQQWQQFEGKVQMDPSQNAVDWDKLFWSSDAPLI